MQVNLKHPFFFSVLNQGLLLSGIATAGGLCLLAANTYTIALGIGDNQLGQACLSLVFSLCLLLCHIEGILLNGCNGIFTSTLCS